MVVNYALSIILTTWTYTYSSLDDDSDDNTLEMIYRAEVRLSTVGDFFERIAASLFIITLVELGNGFMYARTHTRQSSQTVLRYVAYATAFVLFVIAVAYLGKTTAVWEPYLADDGPGFNNPNYKKGFDFVGFRSGLDITQKLYAAHDILNFIVAIPLVVYASMVVHKYRYVPFIKSVSAFAPLSSLAPDKH